MVSMNKKTAVRSTQELEVEYKRFVHKPTHRVAYHNPKIEKCSSTHCQNKGSVWLI